ncbi:MAG: hypothetical protein MUD12_08545 [Spirochaetes bacterium]|nr:hypothetical protein [Spirochaetota bacterium]
MRLKPLLIILILTSALSLRADVEYIRYHNKSFNYTVMIPAAWEKAKADFEYKHVLSLKKGRHTEIRITAVNNDSEEKIKWKNWKEWYVKDVGGGLKKIIESKDVQIEKYITGKLLLFEYNYKGNLVLERILISDIDDNMIIIECRSPISTYKKYIEVFNTVMGSLKKTGKELNENVDK